MRMPLIVLTLFSLLAPSVWAKDERVDLHVYRFESQGKHYRLVALNLNPNAWDHTVLSDGELSRRYFAEAFLQSIQEFLKQRHMADGKTEEGSAIQKLILQSFVRHPNPFGSLAFTDAGRARHKVDEYFDHRTLAVAVYEEKASDELEMLGTIKFVVNSAVRQMAPRLGDLKGFAPVALATGQAPESEGLNIEYENLARHTEGLSPVPLMLKFAVQSGLFGALTEGPREAHLWANVEDKPQLLDFYKRLAFAIVPGFYEGLPAHRIRAEAQAFAEAVENYAASKAANPGYLQPKNLRQMNWQTPSLESWSTRMGRPPMGLCEAELASALDGP